MEYIWQINNLRSQILIIIQLSTLFFVEGKKVLVKPIIKTLMIKIIAWLTFLLYFN